MVEIEIPLFLRPEHMLSGPGPVKPKDLRELATQLHEDLMEAADILEKLQAGGCEANVMVYDLQVDNAPCFRTKAQAVAWLKRLGIDPDAVQIHEYESEEDDEVVKRNGKV
jgi:hypothetical protein